MMKKRAKLVGDVRSTVDLEEAKVETDLLLTTRRFSDWSMTDDDDAEINMK